MLKGIISRSDLTILDCLHVSFFLCHVYVTQTDKKALEILTYLGLTLSLIGISLTILGYVFLT